MGRNVTAVKIPFYCGLCDYISYTLAIREILFFHISSFVLQSLKNASLLAVFRRGTVFVRGGIAGGGELRRAKCVYVEMCERLNYIIIILRHLSTGERTNTRAVQLITANRCCAPV